MGLLAAALAAAFALDVPFVAQEKETCGAASLSMVLGYWDEPVAQAEIAATLLEPALHGIPGSRLAAFARARGFTAIAYEGDVAQLRDFLHKGRPLVVALAAGGGRYHNVVVVGFDDAAGDVLVNDPAEGAGRRIRLRLFEKRWAGAGRWTLLVLPASP